MAQRIRTYTGENIDVTYDAGRCIHVAECIKRLPTVFDTGKRPWVQPDNAPADNVAQTVLACPSGALHARRKDGSASEPVQDHNTIRLVKNGPLYVRGDFTIVNGLGKIVVNDTRAALCRCGASGNKPFCDNSHTHLGFQAPATVSETQTVLEPMKGGRLHIEATTDGPLHITGNFTVLNGEGEAVFQGIDEWFCRCGASNNKPFCDNSHSRIGFVAG